MTKPQKLNKFMETIESTYYLIRIGPRGSALAQYYAAESAHGHRPRLYRLLADPDLQVSPQLNENQVRAILKKPSLMGNLNNFSPCPTDRIRRGTVIDWHFNKRHRS